MEAEEDTQPPTQGEKVEDIALPPQTPTNIDTPRSEHLPPSSPRKDDNSSRGHRVVLTVTAVIACSKGSDEQSKLLEELAKRNKRTLEAPKPQQFFHCEYGIAPKHERTVVDIVSYGIAAKVFTENDSRVIKTWDDGARIWVAWVNSHELFITEENILDLYQHQLEFKLWDSKDKVSAKARFDRPKAFRIPSTKDSSPGKGVANIVAKQSRSWTSLQPKDSKHTGTDIADTKPLIDVPTPPPKDPNLPPARVRSSLGRLAGLDISDHEKKRINELKMQQSKLMKQLNKNKGDSGTENDKQAESLPGKDSKKNSADATSTRTVTVPIKLELLFSGMKDITARLEHPSVNVEDMYVSVSVGGRLMPEELERKLNPLVITINSVKDLPDTPIPRNKLADLCQPVYCSYKFLDQPIHKTLKRPHDKDVHFQDIHVILAGKLDSGKLFEFLHSDGMTVEVHDRDRKLPDVVKPPLIFGDDDTDRKIANVGLVSSKNTTHNAFHDRHRIYDPYGITKIRLNELLHGNATLTFTSIVNPCPIPDLLTNPSSAEPGARLVGVVGSIDRPENPPLATGNYLSSGTVVKIKVSLKYPLDFNTSQETEDGSLNEVPCPFARVIYHFNYENKQLLKVLESFVTESNILALGFDQFDRNVAEAALSTYKLSDKQRESSSLDVVTGFHVIDGEFHLFILEGLKNGSMKRLREEIGHATPNAGGFVRMLCDTSVSFKSRLYAELDINLCKVRLHQPLKTILEQPLLYVRDLVPRPCFQCLVMLKDVVKANCLKDICRNALFPSSEMVISMSREFGIPITHSDFEEHRKKQAEEDEKSASALDLERSPKWTPIDNTNREFDKYMSHRHRYADQQPDYVLSNIVSVQEAGRRRRPVSRAKFYAELPGVSFNYSTQTLNSTELSKTALRKMLYENDKDSRYAYNELYNSAMISPVDQDAHYRDEEDHIKEQWRTDTGFVFPGVKTSLMCNAHPKHPNDARVDELKLKWRENTLHDHILKPTLRREIWSWDLRNQDMNLYSKPPHEFGETPLSIHLPGQKAMQEVLESKRRDREEWESKIIVDNMRMKFHAVGSKTEQESVSKQVDKLQKILKDEPTKLALRYNPPLVPPLSVVSYPEVDREAREIGKRMPPGMSRSQRSPIIALQPGPSDESSLKIDKNTIPIKDPEHQKFAELKGSDFNPFLKVREYMWKKSIYPLSSREKENELFQTPLRPAAPKKKVIVVPAKTPEEPKIQDKRSEYKTRYMPNLDPRPRLPILPRDQLGGLSHLLQKDASVELAATKEEAEAYVQAQENLRKTANGDTKLLADDVQLVHKALDHQPVLQSA